MISSPGRLPPSLQRTLAARGHTHLTPVQRAVLEALPAEADLLVSAPTGSGKTVAFGIALAVTIGDAVCAAMAGVAACGLVIAPTRELAQQVCDELRWLLAGTGLRTVCVTGGGSEAEERARLRGGGAVVVGTPGRLSAHVAGGALDLGRCRMVVIDEADEMLALGFRAELDGLLALPQAPVRVMLLSATVSAEVEQVARRYQSRQLRLDLLDGRQACPGFDLAAIEIIARDRNAALVNLLRFHDPRAAVIFCNRRALVAVLAARLAAQGFRVVTLSGALPQPERQAALEAMRSGAAQVCVATDLAARGLDLPGLDLVLNAEVPSGSQALLHRSGRSGRTDRRGRSVILATRRERARVEALASGAKLPLDWETVPAPEAVRKQDLEAIAADPCFHDPPDSETRALAARLAARHGLEDLAVAAARGAGRDRAASPRGGLPFSVPWAQPSGPAARARLWRSMRPDPVPLEARSGGKWFEVAADGDDPARMGDVVRRVSERAGVPRGAIGRVHVGPEQVRFEVTGVEGERLRQKVGATERGTTFLRPCDGPRRPGKRTR